MRSPVVQPEGIVRPLVQLAWPVLVEQVLAMLVGFSDTVLAGHYLSESHLAAMTVLAYLMWAFNALFSAIAIGATAMTARYAGAGDYEAANRVANQSLLLGTLLATVVTLACLGLGEHLVWAMQLEGEAADLATRYLNFLLPMVPAIMLEAVIIACLHGVGDTITGLVSMVLVNVINIAVSWTLILGAGPFPKLGWDGLAIGTSLGYAIGGIVPLVVLAWGRAGLKLHWRQLRLDLPLARRILRVGLPGGADSLTIIGCQLLFLGLVNRLGTLAIAAHGVAIRLESLAYLPGIAFQVAASTLAGQYLGAGDYRRATRAVLAACACGSSLMLGAGVLMFFGADQLVHLLLAADQEEVAQVAVPLLRIVSVAMLPLSVMMVLTGALRGAGDTRWPLAVSLIGFLGVRLPLAWLLAIHWAWGVRGAWYAMAADLFIRCLLIVYRFWHGGWKRIEL